MNGILEWTRLHWVEITTGIGILINILNAMSRHFTAHKGAVKFILILTELLSVIRSSGATPGKVLGNLKLPLSLPGSLPKGVILLPLICSLASLSACGTTARGAIHKSLIAVDAAEKLITPEVNKICFAKAQSCKKAGHVLEGNMEEGFKSSCTEWQTCDAARTIYSASFKAIVKQLGVVNGVLVDLGVD